MARDTPRLGDDGQDKPRRCDDLFRAGRDLPLAPAGEPARDLTPAEAARVGEPSGPPLEDDPAGEDLPDGAGNVGAPAEAYVPVAAAETEVVALREQVEPREADLERLRQKNAAQQDALQEQVRAFQDVETQEQQAGAVAEAVVTSELGVLIARRVDGSPPWAFPGGKLEAGESAEQAAVREVIEEAGLLVRATGIIGQRVHPQTGRLLVYVAAEPVRGTSASTSAPEELAEVRWVMLAGAGVLLPDMFVPVRNYLARVLGK
jgi:8-oxo-dGTP diphosphatase